MKNVNDINEIGSFEEAIKELEIVVRKLEEGNIPLEDSLDLFKQGITLTELCNKILTNAQGEVDLLTRSKLGQLQETPFDHE